MLALAVLGLAWLVGAGVASPAATGAAAPPTFSSRTTTVALPLLSVAWSATRCGPAVANVHVTL